MQAPNCGSTTKTLSPYWRPQENTLTSTPFSRYASAVRNFEGDSLDPSLLMHREGDVSVYYAPFEWVNPQARIVLVGITPGKVQAVNALKEARRALDEGASDEEALRRAKLTGAFSGPMRPNLIALLDSIGMHAKLGLTSCDELFGRSSSLLQTASALQFPVFFRGENYNGTPDPTRHPLLQRLLTDYFGSMMGQLPNAAFIPLGPVPSKALDWLVAKGVVKGSQVLHGLPHPSGANGERIAFFLGRKQRSELSAKTNAVKLEASKAALIAAVSSFRA